MTLKFKRLRPEARLPAFGHDDPTNAGLDLFLAEGREIGAYQDAWLPTGIAWEPPWYDGSIDREWAPAVKWALLIRGRASSARRCLLVTEGTVDAGYRGEIMVHVRNMGPLRVDLAAGDRIAQAVPIFLPWIEVQEVDELGESTRGARGFGSSGA